MSTKNVVNPGLVNVADQADGPTLLDQAVAATRPCTDAGPLVQAAAVAPGHGVLPAPNVTPPMTAGETVQAGTYSPTSPSVETVTQNNVAGQVYGSGSPRNVFV